MVTGLTIGIAASAFTLAAEAEVLRSKKGITAVGNAQVSTAQSKFGGASALFDGSGDYLTLGAGSVTPGLALTSNFWTVEYWARITSHVGAFQATVAIWNDVNGVGNVYYFSTNIYNGTNKMGFQYNYGTNSDSGALAFGSSTLATGVWQHHAFVRNGNTLTAYLDGVSQGTHDMTGRTIDITGFNNSGANSVPVTIGGMSTGSGSFNGYLDEIRISNSARYTAGFTAPTAPFVNDANTVLLIHADGTNASTFFEDDNGVRAPIGLAAGNNAKISTAQSKFGGSSIEFDGTDDFVTVAGLPSYANSNYTFECWARFDILPHTQTIGGGAYMMMNFAGGGDYVLINRIGAGSQVNIQIAHAGGYGSFTKSGVNYAINTWYHIAVVRNSGVFKVFFNGTDLTTFTNDSGFVNSGRTQNIIVNQLGKFGDSRGSWDGYMDEIRVSNTARYTGDYTPHTVPHVNDVNTQLLIHADGTNNSTVIRDDNGALANRTQKGIQALGNAQVDTAQSQFGGSSALFDGTGDLLQLDSSASLIIPLSQDFTIEGWIRPGSVSGTPGLLTDRASSQTLSGANWDISIFNGSYLVSRTNTLLFETGSGAGSIVIISNNNVFTTNTWYHFAVVRSSNVISLYVNGVDVTNNRAGTQSAGIGAGNLTIGGFPNNELFYTGHMDEIRWSNTARYTTAFTPSTTPFQNDANTVLLLHMDGTDGSTVFTDDNGVAPYTP
jgi:hypothetical protein